MADDPFAGLDGDDGYRIECCEEANYLALFLTFYKGGQQINFLANQGPDASFLLREWHDQTPEDRGACTRLELLLRAVCRYLNTGGTFPEMARAVAVVQGFAVGGLVFPGYYYAQARQTYGGDYEHIFVDSGNSEQAVLWQEGGDVGPPRPLEEIINEWCILETQPGGEVRAAPAAAEPLRLQHTVGLEAAPGAGGAVAGGAGDDDGTRPGVV